MGVLWYSQKYRGAGRKAWRCRKKIYVFESNALVIMG